MNPIKLNDGEAYKYFEKKVYDDFQKDIRTKLVDVLVKTEQHLVDHGGGVAIIVSDVEVISIGKKEVYVLVEYNNDVVRKKEETEVHLHLWPVEIIIFDKENPDSILDLVAEIMKKKGAKNHAN